MVVNSSWGYFQRLNENTFKPSRFDKLTINMLDCFYLTFLVLVLLDIVCYTFYGGMMTVVVENLGIIIIGIGCIVALVAILKVR